MWDFRDNMDAQPLARTIYGSGGIVSAICHGPASLADVKLSNVEYLAAGRNTSAFTASEEGDMERPEVMPFLLETTLREREAVMHTSENRTPMSIIGGPLVTGQNPQSGHAVAQNILKVSAELN